MQPAVARREQSKSPRGENDSQMLPSSSSARPFAMRNPREQALTAATYSYLCNMLEYTGKKDADGALLNSTRAAMAAIAS